MPKIQYITKKFSSSSLSIIEWANEIITDYLGQGFKLTLRQLYYQFVARGLIPNVQSEYKRIGSIINDARLAGMIDWEAIEDRTRNLQSLAHWDSPSELLDACARQYRIDKWEGQEFRPEVWCFVPETPIVTNNGIIPIKNVSLDMKSLGSTGYFNKVLHVFKRRYQGKILNIKAAGVLNMEVTPEHPFYVCKPDNYNKGVSRRNYTIPNFIQATHINKFDWLCIPRIKQTIDIKTVKMTGGPRSKKIGKVVFNYELCKIIGLYLSEGCIRKDQRTVQFSINKHRTDLVSSITNWVNRIGLNFSEASSPGTKIIYISSKALVNWLKENFGCGAYNKHFPYWFYFLPVNKQLKTLEYYFNGDGTIDKNTSLISIATRSKELAMQSQIIFIRAGLVANVCAINDHDKPIYHITITGKFADKLSKKWGVLLPKKTRRYNHTKIGKNFAYFPVRKVKTSHYDGYVYNLKIEKDNTYCVPCIVHNCEKEALIGIIQDVCNRYDVAYFACKGYTSQSEMWGAGERLISFQNLGQTPVIIHLGDHDPSGIDMTRDIKDRLTLFLKTETKVNRIALNRDQIEAFNPPPNPAKTTDSRYQTYILEFGEESWELDALEPNILVELIEDTILSLRDDDLWKEKVAEERVERAKLRKVAKNWK